jgi:hypothetical protein
MPITSDIGGRDYTLGRGKLYFDRYTPAQIAAGLVAATQGDGERFFGNVPEFSFNTTEETLDHFASTGGVRQKDDSVSLQIDRNGSFNTDHIHAENHALWFLSDAVASVVQASATAATWDGKSKKDAFIQVGSSPSVPTGVRDISSVVITHGVGFATTLTPSGNYEVDEANGRIYFLPGCSLADGTAVRVTYNAAAGTRNQVVSKGTAVYGALRFIADNPKGPNKDFYIPLCKVTPEGDYSLISDDWQSLPFAFEIVKKGALEGVYIDGRPA